MNSIIEIAEETYQRYQKSRYVFDELIYFHQNYKNNLEKWKHWEAIRKMVADGNVKLFAIRQYMSKSREQPFPIIQRILPKSTERLSYEDMKAKKFKKGDFEPYRRLNFFPMDKIFPAEFVHLINSESEFRINPQRYKLDETAPPITVQNLLIDSNSHQYLFVKVKLLPKKRESHHLLKRGRVQEACRSSWRGHHRNFEAFKRLVKTNINEQDDFKDLKDISENLVNDELSKFWDMKTRKLRAS